MHGTTHIPGDGHVRLVVDTPSAERATTSEAGAAHWITWQAVDDCIGRDFTHTIDQTVLLIENASDNGVGRITPRCFRENRFRGVVRRFVCGICHRPHHNLDWRGTDSGARVLDIA